MSKLLQEIYEATAKVLFEGKNKDGNPTMNILVPFCQSDEATSNDRTYPRALMTRQIERVQKDIESGKFLGTSDHNAKLDNVSHIVSKAWLDKNGQGWMEAKIIPTTKGKNLMTIVKEGGAIGVSTRGFGTVKNGKVQDDYVLKGIDCVLDNAYEKGTFNKDSVFESMSFEDKNDSEGMDRVKKEIERITKREQEMMETLKYIFDEKKEKGYSGTWEEFLLLNEESARKRYGLPPKEKKMKEKLKTPVPMKRLKPNDFVWESFMSGIPATEMASRHNKIVDAKEKQAKEKQISVEDERLLRQMYLSAGDSPEQADKRVEERRGQPKIKTELTDEWKEAIAELMEQYDWDFETALKKLKAEEQEEENKQEKKKARRKEIREILERQ